MRVLSLAAFAVVPAGVVAWGAAGHEIVGTIAQIYLLPSAKSNVCAILGMPFETCTLAPAATWADRIKSIPSYRWANVLHYVNPLGDHPSQTCTFGDEGWAGRQGMNVLGGIRNTTDFLLEGRPGAAEALKFLIHFLGDLHMPLHLTGREKGGNGVKVHFGRRSTNLHSVWDGLLIAKAIRETPQNYTRPLPSRRVEGALNGAIYDSYIRQIVWEGLLGRWQDDLVRWASCPTPAEPSIQQSILQRLRLAGPPTDDEYVCPYAWAAEIHSLNCEIVWPAQLDEDKVGPDAPELLELDEPWYSGRIRKEFLVERLLATAGIRLAAVLNDIYADRDDLKSLTPLLDLA
ncbi:phospholipase C/P1 nuclease [Auriculariales sp. MPI-PUGE-AT-0066]|nr:phospholipase C/P1 nuclease [Auriculariales sp. MPI-PUGE-AT-0066]